jgi:hypothetical protein
VTRITGMAVEPEAYLQYLEKKFGEIYKMP